MPGYEDAVKAKLKEAGCSFHRQGKGDYEIWVSPITGKKFPVDQGIKSRHTANGIMKQAGIAYRFRESLGCLRRFGLRANQRRHVLHAPKPGGQARDKN